MSKLKYFIGLPMILFLSASFTSSVYTLKVDIPDLKSDKGKIMLQLFNSDKEVVGQHYVVIKNKKAAIKIDNLSKGRYAVRVFHDENDNDELDTDFFGAPAEGYGYSNNAKGFWGPPEFEEQLFQLSKDEAIQIKLIY